VADYSLSSAERAVVVLVAHGLTNLEAAERLGVSVSTVKWHLKRVAHKWGTRSTAGTVGLAYRSGAIYAEPDVVAPEGVWSTRLRESGYELERLPEMRGDRRRDPRPRRGEDRTVKQSEQQARAALADEITGQAD
jgi:DNA-binding CsgD family transcriptional regulator